METQREIIEAWGRTLVVIVAFLSIFAWTAFWDDSSHMIIHPEFKDGVALCAPGAPDMPRTETGNQTAIQWQESGVYYLINWDYQDSPAVNSLKKLAEKQCSK